jgi:hypothetical protein
LKELPSIHIFRQFHKEKEMVAFRKWLPALAALSLIIGSAASANAQALDTTFRCQTNAGVPPIVRAEGFTELTGDLVLVCRGGIPGQTIISNVQIFLNTNVTSRGISGDGANATTESLLLIGDPGPTALAEGVTYVRGRKALQGQNSIVFPNVTFGAPGSQGEVVLRIVNVRADARSLGVSSTAIPTQIVAFVSASPVNSLPIDNPQQTVAFVQTGLLFDVRNCRDSDSVGTTANFVQCVSQNPDLFNAPTSNRGASSFVLRFQEGFQTAFKQRILVGQNPSTPGVVYNSESGFTNTLALGNRTGLSDNGTRLAARFNNVPNGVRIFATVRNINATASRSAVLVQTGPNGEGGTTSDISGDPIGVTPNVTIGDFGATDAALRCARAGNNDNPNGVEIPILNGTGLAVWEVTAADQGVQDGYSFAVSVGFAANTPNNLPAPGQSTVTGNLAPFYAAGDTRNPHQISTSLPIPRFVDNPISRNDFVINTCQTNLLFPFVTNQAGFDTGVAISNTSRDVFANQNERLQSGRCTANYFGEGANQANAPQPFTTNANLEAGRTWTFVLSTGGGLGMDNRAAGFQGYLIVQCQFQFAHGFAFITDGPIGQARVAEGYLALVLDEGIAARGTLSEVLGH